MNRYLEHMYPELFKRAGHPRIFGKAVYSAADMVGIENATEMKKWTDGALFCYRSRRTFMNIVANPNIERRHEFKLAALGKTIAYPLEISIYFGGIRLWFELVLLTLRVWKCRAPLDPDFKIISLLQPSLKLDIQKPLQPTGLKHGINIDTFRLSTSLIGILHQL